MAVVGHFCSFCLFVVVLRLSTVAAWATSLPLVAGNARLSARPGQRERWLCTTDGASVASPPTFSLPDFKPSRIALNGVEHYVRDTGDPSPAAPIAILLHGFAGNTDSW